jgi:hypothetical protein
VGADATAAGATDAVDGPVGAELAAPGAGTAGLAGALAAGLQAASSTAVTRPHTVSKRSSGPFVIVIMPSILLEASDIAERAARSPISAGYR